MDQAASAAQRVKEIALGYGASACGIAPADTAAEYARFAAAVENLPAPLGYLTRGLPKRKNMREFFPGATAVLVCAFTYWDASKNRLPGAFQAADPGQYLLASGRRVSQPGFLKAPGAKLSRYVHGPDYHAGITEKLAAMLKAIGAEFPGVSGKPFCDASPVMEKELGRLAGLGFRGRNTILISPALGSWFFLGGLALDLPLQPDAPAAGDCGDCRRCEEACPSGALTGGKLSPEKCLSYWTTQAKEPAPADIASASRACGYAYGCDVCQEVCPHNLKEGK